MPGKAGRRWCSRWVSAERAASRRRMSTASQAQARSLPAVSAGERTDPLLEVFEVQVDVADAVLVVDQIGVHQRVAQDHQAGFVVRTRLVEAEIAQDAYAIVRLQGVEVQRCDRTEDIMSLLHPAQVAGYVA